MAVTFLDPGGDAQFLAQPTTGGGFWSAVNFVTIATDHVNTGHVKSYNVNNSGYGSSLTTPTAGVVQDSGTRISFWIYLVTLPASTGGLYVTIQSQGGGAIIYQLKITSAGVLQMFETTSQIGTNGATLSTGVWYRISLCYNVTSTTVNQFNVYVNGVSSISITNATLTNISTTTTKGSFGNGASGSVYRYSDIYIDNSASTADPGNIYVTAKRPVANGTTNNFNTQIGSGGSGYGTGHSPQVNERPLSVTNGWSVVASGVTVEEYNIEGQTVGDVSISGATIVDYLGWVYVKALLAETGQLILNGVNNAISITTSNGMFTVFAGSSTYPTGTGADVGLSTSATATTVSLYECGVVVAYIPAVVVPNSITSDIVFFN